MNNNALATQVSQWIVEGPFGKGVNGTWIVTAEHGSVLIAETYRHDHAILIAEANNLLSALRELALAANPHTNMSDIPVYEALALARTIIARVEGA